MQANSILRNKGYNIVLTLVGTGLGDAHSILNKSISKFDPDNLYVRQKEFIPHSQLPNELSRVDISVFASSCENMPNTLLEAMAAGLPIACSDRGPMPEVLQDAGVYFDPEDALSIANALEKIINCSKFRERIASRARELSSRFSWKRCSDETFMALAETVCVSSNLNV